MRSKLLIAMLAGTCATTAAACAVASGQTINVVVNQVPVVFNGAPPQEINNSVVVPLRGVFEQLGASVSYDAASKQIQSRRGNTLVVLTIGQTTAFVNGVPQTLTQPAIVEDGTTLVPLRFVAQSFGADVAWLPSSQTVEINTVDQHLSTLPLPPVNARGDAVGTLTGVFQNTNPPQITLRVDGQNTAVPLSGDTVVLVQRDSGPAVQGDPHDLRIGDQVRVSIDSSGTASVIRVTFGELTGTVKSVGSLGDGTSVITLNDGQSVVVAPDAVIMMAGRHMQITDIMPNDHVVIHYNTGNHTAYFIDLPTHVDNGPSGPPAPNGNGPSHASIDSFTVDSSGPYKAGDQIQVTLQGTPGLHGVFSIPGIVEAAPMREVSPGVYHGVFTVPPAANIQSGNVLAQLQPPGGSEGASPLIQAAQTVTIDTTPPRISGQNPPPDSTVTINRPRIYAVTEDSNGTGVDPHATRISIDGNDVTQDAIVTNSFVTYQPTDGLSDGPHDITIRARDIAGNTTNAQWSFAVSGGHRIVQGISTNLPDGVTTLNAGTPLVVTLHAQPGGQATFSIGSAAHNVPMHEDSPGVYIGRFTPSAGSSVQSAPVVAKFVSTDGSAVTTATEQPLTIDAGPPHAPRVDSPADGDTVGDDIVVTGHAQPGLIVDISIDYHTKAFGGILPLAGHAADTEVRTDSKGMWKTDTLHLNSTAAFAMPRNTTYTLTAICVDEAGQQSDPTTETFKHQ